MLPEVNAEMIVIKPEKKCKRSNEIIAKMALSSVKDIQLLFDYSEANPADKITKDYAKLVSLGQSTPDVGPTTVNGFENLSQIERATYFLSKDNKAYQRRFADIVLVGALIVDLPIRKLAERLNEFNNEFKNSLHFLTNGQNPGKIMFSPEAWNYWNQRQFNKVLIWRRQHPDVDSENFDFIDEVVTKMIDKLSKVTHYHALKIMSRAMSFFQHDEVSEAGDKSYKYVTPEMFLLSCIVKASHQNLSMPRGIASSILKTFTKAV